MRCVLLVLVLLPACSKTPEEALCKRLTELMEKQGVPIPSGGSVGACARGLEELKRSKPTVWACARPCMETAESATQYMACVPDCSKSEKAEAKKDPAREKPEPYASLSNRKVAANAKHAFWVRGLLGDKNIAHNGDFTVDLALFSPHAGNVVELGAQKVTLESGRAVLKLDLKPLLFAALGKTEIKTDSIFNPPSQTLPVKITTRDGQTKTGELVVATMDLFPQWAEQTAIAGKPMVIDGEKPGANAFRGLLFKDTRSFQLLGKAASWEEIDLVASSRIENSRTQRCGTYRGSKSGKVVALDITLNDELAEIRDRRTGKVVRKQLFRASGTCPKSTTSTATQSFFVPTTTVTAWCSKQLRK
jgi:hypothetical protein